MNSSASGKQDLEPKEDVGITSYSYVCYMISSSKITNNACVITFIDYTAAFDSISHKFMDVTLAKAGASRKSRAIFRAIYSATTGSARVRSTDGEHIFSGTNVQNW